MDTAAPTATATATNPLRSPADRAMRRLLRLPVDAPKQSIMGTESVFGKSIMVSGLRCTLTYIVLPLVAPIFNLTGASLPVIGLVLGAVSMVAITISMRRFFAADHKYRWGYAIIGGSIFVMLIIAGIADISTLINRY
jgi:uncharacterized membrane protein YphA (DoxX/SURF4 family)